MERIRIEGIKLSNELVGINFRNLSCAKDYISRFSHILTKNQVNLIFLSFTNIGDNNQVFCCVGIEDRLLVEELIKSDFDLASHADFISPVGSLSIFTHQFSLKILGLILNVFGKTPLPLHGLASSLSVLTCITDYSHLKNAVTAVQEYLYVPSGQISLEPEIYVKQTSHIEK